MLRDILLFNIVYLVNSVSTFTQTGDYVKCNFNHEKNDYDLLVLAQSWPLTGCWALNDKWPSINSSKCPEKYYNQYWTVHGLWPSNRNENHPFNCQDIPYNPKLLNEKLIAQMEAKWFTYNLNETNDDFWKHEWSKHGTCAMNLKETNSFIKYFVKTLDLLDKYNVGDILKQSRIIPGNEYNINDVIFAIRNGLGVDAFVNCAINPITRASYLIEVYICMDKSFRLIDCNFDNGKKTNCETNLIIYPKN